MLLLLEKLWSSQVISCTFHNSSGALTCAHFWPDRVIRIMITANGILSRFLLWAPASFMKWVLCQCLPLPAVMSSHLYYTYSIFLEISTWFCFVVAMFPVWGIHVVHVPISFMVISIIPRQSYDCLSGIEITMKDMGIKPQLSINNQCKPWA